MSFRLLKSVLCIGAAVSLCISYIGCTKTEEEEEVPGAFELSSPSFQAGQPIPTECSCDGKPFGQGGAPELNWTAGPTGTKSYAVVFQDTSIVSAAPEFGNHWIIWNIPASVKTLPRNLSGEQFPPAMGGAQQLNAAPPQANGQYVYFGPCPNWNTFCSGAARTTDTYAFTVYAFNFESVNVPAKDTTDPTNKNYVRQINAFLAAKAIGSAKLVTTSDAAPTAFDFCPPAPAESLKISSTKFNANDSLPAAYGCEGKIFGAGIAPELKWTGGPATAKSYAIVFKDVSLLAVAPEYAYHWMIWNIPDSVKTLPEGLSSEKFPPAMKGAEQVSAGPDGGFGYMGPCPNWQTYCSRGDVAAVQDTYSFTIYALSLASVTLPAKDTTKTKNYVGQISKFFDSIAIAKAEIKTWSKAVPDSAPQLCSVTAIPTPGMVDSEYQYMTFVGADFLADSIGALNKWYDSIHIPTLMPYPGLKFASRFKDVGSDTGAKPGYFAWYWYSSKGALDSMQSSTQFTTAIGEMVTHWNDSVLHLGVAVSYEKMKSWVRKDYTGALGAVTVVCEEIAAGKEKETNDWFDNVHMPLIMKYAGVKKAVRYKKLAGAGDINPDSIQTYLAVYYYPSAIEQNAQGTSDEWAKVVANMTSEPAFQNITIKSVKILSNLKDFTK